MTGARSAPYSCDRREAKDDRGRDQVERLRNYSQTRLPNARVSLASAPKEFQGQSQGQQIPISRGGVRIRTGVRGFAGPCLTTRPRRQKFLCYLVDRAPRRTNSHSSATMTITTASFAMSAIAEATMDTMMITAITPSIAMTPIFTCTPQCS